MGSVQNTPDGVEYDAPPTQGPPQTGGNSRVMIEQRDGQFVAQCQRQGEPRPQPSPVMHSFDELVAYLANEFGAAPAQAAPPPAAAAPPSGDDDHDY